MFSIWKNIRYLIVEEVACEFLFHLGQLTNGRLDILNFLSAKLVLVELLICLLIADTFCTFAVDV